jgi:multicomponent Na+:H+ antiporter subunit B
MKTVILKTAANYLLPLLLLFSIFILIRGHYLPGGGFIGGLVASIAFVLHAFANGLNSTREYLRFHPGVAIPIGLAISILNGIAPMLKGLPYMEALWFPDPVVVIGMVGSPLFFDIGVFIVVVGVTLTILFSISEAIQE